MIRGTLYCNQNFKISVHGFKNDARERNLKRGREEERSLVWKLL